jgi:lysyl-tRNA synthetase class I
MKSRAGKVAPFSVICAVCGRVLEVKVEVCNENPPVLLVTPCSQCISDSVR